jgi:hypothetical protein
MNIKTPQYLSSSVRSASLNSNFSSKFNFAPYQEEFADGELARMEGDTSIHMSFDR